MANPFARKNTAQTTITVYVCGTCDRIPARHDTPQAEGAGFLKAVRARFRQPVAPNTKIIVKAVKCLGGCEALPAASPLPNGCCSVGLAAPGRFSYVLNKFNPATDLWKLDAFLRLYLLRPNGLIRCADSPHAAELKPHVATRVPPPSA